MIVYLLACSSVPPEPPAESDDTAPATADPWGVVTNCSVKRDRSGFSDWYDADDAVLVHGDSPEDAAFAETVYGWYAEAVDGFAGYRAASDLTDEDRAKNLFVLGHP